AAEPQCIGGTTRAAHIGEFRERVTDPLLRHDIAQKKAAASRHPERQSVRSRNVVEVIRKDDTGRTRHIPSDDIRIAGNVFAEVARQHPHFAVDPAAGRQARDDGERLAIEILGARSDGASECQEDYYDGSGELAHCDYTVSRLVRSALIPTSARPSRR